MREIKFRAWDKNKKCMITGQWMWWVGFNGEVWDMQSDIPIEYFELMQYTGLKDKNGKEIYEGDILDYAGLKPIEIVFEGCAFRAKMRGTDMLRMTQDGMSAFAEVIGNIYENPEFLEKHENNSS